MEQKMDLTNIPNSVAVTTVSQKLKWTMPVIALMLAQETNGKFSNPREGGNSTEGFVGPS